MLAAGLAAAIKPLVPSALAKSSSADEFDYIVIGAGAGGGPVAARLANAGYKVALLDAGVGIDAGNAIDPNSGIIYLIPASAGFAAEHPVLSWEFWVKHYSNLNQQKRDSKYRDPKGGIIYPRGSTLGGSTAHDAMVMVYPHDQDWDDIAEATGDNSWRARYMRGYFQRLEKCDYCTPNAPGRGLDGYINTNVFDPQILTLDTVLRDVSEAGQTLPVRDVNDPVVAKGGTGTFKTPMHVGPFATPFGAVTKARVSIREHLLKTQAAHPDKLFLITGALATRLLTRGDGVKGVEFMQTDPVLAASLYEANKLYNPSVEPKLRRIFAKREVIVSAGVFNTPQLLMLSGIGPARQLRNQFGIDVVADLPGVGRNLQDRYEISVVSDLKNEFGVYTACDPTKGPADPCLGAWFSGQWPGATGPFFGPYANNALYTSRISKSSSARELPDLFIAGQATEFNGFVPGFSNMTLGKTWTWLILKCHTNNTAGRVKLKSTDPRVMPDINFHYFEEGNDGGGDDLEAVVEAVKLARGFNEQAPQHIDKERFPGPEIDTDRKLRQYIRDQAWGHHAGCTAKIGSRHDWMSVLDSRFRVRGVDDLRVVDISSFPRLPGFFPVASVMMIGEKAGDVILEDAKRKDRDREHHHRGRDRDD
jgi:choline dehydrogenase